MSLCVENLGGKRPSWRWKTKGLPSEAVTCLAPLLYGVHQHTELQNIFTFIKVCYISSGTICKIDFISEVLLNPWNLSPLPHRPPMLTHLIFTDIITSNFFPSKNCLLHPTNFHMLYFHYHSGQTFKKFPL